MTADPILTLAWLILAHLVADFLIQTSGVVAAKTARGGRALRGFANHALGVAVCLVPVALAFGGPGILVLFMDALKGYAASAWLANGLLKLLNLPNPDPQTNHLIAGIAAVIGHNYTCWLQFKGGKGIATTGGVYLALAPWAVSLAILTWIVFVFATRYVSVASIAAAAVLPLAVWLTSDSLTLKIVTLILGLLAIIKHKENIKRLRAGTERRFGEKPAEAPK